jgi:hypothetical protein
VSASRFIVIRLGSNQPKEEVVTDFIKSKGYGFWHWASDVWLITSRKELTAGAMRDELLEVFGGQSQYIVIKPDGKTHWAAMTKKDSAGKSPATWFHETWDKFDPPKK